MSSPTNGPKGQDGRVAAQADVEVGRDVAVDGSAFANVGEWLAARRAALGRTLEEAEAATRVREDYLDAIETMDPRRMPEGPYAPGFVRTYALYLDLDPDAATERFRSEMSPRRSRRPRVEADGSDFKLVIPSQLWGGGLVALVLGGLIFFGLSSRDGGLDVVPAVPEGLERWVEADIVGRRTSAAPELVGGPELALRARVPVWIEARILEGEVLISRNVAAGEIWVVPRLRGVRVSSDNGGAVDILRDGQADGRLGAPGLPISAWNADAARGLEPPEPVEDDVPDAVDDVTTTAVSTASPAVTPAVAPTVSPAVSTPEPVVAAVENAIPPARIGGRLSAPLADSNGADRTSDAALSNVDETELISPELPTASAEIESQPLPFLFLGDVTPPADGDEEGGPDDGADVDGPG